MSHVKKIVTRAKRRIAALMVIVMTLQSLLTSVNVVALAAPSGPDPENNIFALKGSPEEAFEYIYVQLGNEVSGEGDELSVTYWYRLNDEWLEGQLEKYLSEGLVDPYSFEFDDTYKDIKQMYGTYDVYLLEQTAVSIEAPTFTCSFDDGFADVDEVMAILSANSGLYTEKGELIGEVTVADVNGPQFHIQFSNDIFIRQNVYGNKGIAIKLINKFEPGTSVEVDKESGENSLEVTIKGKGTPLATDSNYAIEKDYQQGIDMNGDGDPSAINFYITAKASPSSAELATDANASSSNASQEGALTASPSVSGKAMNQTEADDDGNDNDNDDDEIPDDAQDITLEYDWWNLGLQAPIKSNLVRGIRASSSDYEEGTDLTGKYIADAISTNLTLDAAAVSYDDGMSWEFLLPADYGYNDWEEYLSDNSRLFTYQIEGDGVDPVWQCKVMLYTRIADKLWRQYAQTGTLDYEFPNRAVLKSSEDSGTLAVSEKVKPELHWRDMVSKNGQIVDINGNKMRWNIHADAHFGSGVQLYLVDHIADITNTHNYIWDEDGRSTITVNGEDQSVTRLALTAENLAQLAVNLGVDEADIWTELRYGAKDEDKGQGEARYGTPAISTIEALLNLLAEATYNDGTHYAYEYSYENTNGETVTDAVMLISMKDYTEGKTTLTYDTEITAIPDASTGAYEEVVLGNDVRPVWKWSGIGPGEMPTGEINVEKTWKIRTNVVNKSGAGYDDATNTIDWLFDVNQTGKELEHVWIEDPLDTRILAWTGLVAAKEPLWLIPYIRSPEVDDDGQPIDQELPGGTIREIMYVTPADYESQEQDGTTDFYTVVTETDAEGIVHSVLKVHLGAVAADEYYKFRVQTVVVNPHYAQGAELLITNEATAKVMIDGNESEQVDLWAEQTLLHELIDKTAINFEDESEYNYEDNTVKWRLLLNPKKFTISDGTITDTLPLGTKFAEITGVMVDGVDAEWEYTGSGSSRRIRIKNSDVYITLEVIEDWAAYPNDGSGKLYSSDTLVMRFVDSAGNAIDISQTYGLEYTTNVTEDFRQDIIKSNGEGEALDNYVKLSGEIGNAPIIGAKSEAMHKIQPQALLKEGKYHGLSDYTYYYYDENDDLTSRAVKAVYFNWAAYINRLGEDLEGVSISDTLASCFELVPATFRVETVELDAAGKVKDTIQVIMKDGRLIQGQTPLKDLQLDEYGFRFDVPEEYADKTLKITYDTILIDDASAAEMKNAINAKGTGWEDTTGEITDKEAQDFRYSDYNNADGMYFLRIEKISTNDNRDKLYLPGAEFKLTQMMHDGGSASDIANWKETTRVKTRITNSSGVLNFLFIEPNKLYKLEETVAPGGYERETKIWYIAILDGTYGLNGINAANKKNFPVEGPSADDSYEVILINDPEDIGPVHYKNLEIGNTPGSEDNTNELVIWKHGQNGQLLPGVRFLLTGPQMIIATTSDAAGKVRFEKLDPLSNGYYTLAETGVPTGYQQPGSWRVYVTLEDGAYQIVLKEQDEKGNWVEMSDKATDGNWLIQNEPIMNGGSFTKVDQNGDKLSAFTVDFDVYRRDDGGTKEADDSITIDFGKNTGNYEKYLMKEKVSSLEGIVILAESDFYYGYYRLDEVWDADIHAEAPANSIYIKVDQSGVYAVKAGETPTSEEDYSIDLRSVTALKVDNIIKWGLVDVNKVLGTYNADKEEWEVDKKDGAVIPLKDMLFGIYRADGSTAESDAIMFLKTGADGHFIMADAAKGLYKVFDQNGKDLNETRALLIGDYILKESPGTGYWVDDPGTQFTIEPGTLSGDEYQPKPPEIISTDGIYFLNKAIHIPVEVSKVDKDYPEFELNDAEFEIRHNGKTVAGLSYNPSKGYYVLTPLAGAKERDAAGRKYLEELEGKPGEYGLLMGTYTVVETKAPGETFGETYPGYDIATAVAILTISESTATLSGGTLSKDKDTLQNQLKNGDFTINKSVMLLNTNRTDKSKGEYNYSNLAGFKFRITGYPLPAAELLASQPSLTQKQYEQDIVLDASGGTFKAVPLGVYELEEIDVPAEYKMGSGEENWLIKKIPNIWVKITAANDSDGSVGVTFWADSDCTKPLPDSESADQATQSDSSIGKQTGTSVLAYNALKTADVTGIKKTYYSEDGKETSQVLPGVTFTLTHQSLKHPDGTWYEFECVTDATGKISFENVPYGSYVLSEEENSGNYYQPVRLEFTISKDTVDDGVYYLNRDTDPEHMAVLNEVTLANARFLKLDQNGNKITDEQLPLQFAVRRISESITGYPFEKDDVRSYAIDGSGYLTITNLAVGIYEITEDLSLLSAEQQKELASAAALVHFWLAVEAVPSSEKVTVSVYDEPPGGLLSKKLASVTVTHKDTADFTTDDYLDVMSQLMKNVRAYGMVDLNKVRGEWQADQVYEAAEQALAGVEFAIYEADDAGNRISDIPFIILTTNASGNFMPPGQDGLYSGTDMNNQAISKALLTGNYVMREWSTSPDYVLLPTEVPFAVLNQETTWVYSDTDGALKATASEAVKEKTLINVPKRGTLSFDKVDEDSGMYLEDAEFALYLQGTGGQAGEQIGTIRYNAAAGTYQIAAAVVPEVKNAGGIPYLYRDQAGAYHLLAGSYSIKEMTAPTGYHLITDEIEVIIHHDGNTLVTYPSSATEGTITNVIQKASISFVKNVEANPSQPEVNGNGTAFILRGTPSNSDMVWEEKTFTTAQLGGIDGRFDITGLPLGIYALYEKAAVPNSYQGFAGAAEAKILEIAVTAGANKIPQVTYTVIDTKEPGKSPAGIIVIVDESEAAGQVEVINNWKRGSVIGRKAAADNHEIGLNGAVFGLYIDVDCTRLVTTAVSSTAIEPQGRFVFADIAYGTYYVKEIKAPAGYVPSTVVYQVTVDTQEAAITEGCKLDDQSVAGGFEEILFTNGSKRGAVELTKRAAHNGELLAGSAEFTIYADAACDDAVAYLRDSDQDGIYTLSSGTGLAGTVNGVRYLQADENGELLLIQGTYWLKETKVPVGYQAEMEDGYQKVYEFTIYSEDDVTAQLLDTYIITNRDGDDFFYNEMAAGQFTLAKTIEVSRADNLTAAGVGFWFGIAGMNEAGTELVRIDGMTLADAVAAGIAEQMLDGHIRVITGSDGTVVISGLLVGTYTVTELDGPDYELYTGTTPRQVVLKQSDDKAQIITVFDDTEVDPDKEKLTFHNALKRSGIKGLKVTTGGLGLAGATIGLFPADTTEFTEANLFEGMKAVSGANGYFVFEKVPYGTYRIAELTAPSGYRLNSTTSYLVSITENGAEVTIGYKEEKLAAETETSEIKIVNSKSPGGGGGGGGGTPTTPGSPSTMIPENEVPLGETVVYPIDENVIPLGGLPITGDTLPYALLAAIMLGALGGIGVLTYRRKKNNEE